MTVLSMGIDESVGLIQFDEIKPRSQLLSFHQHTNGPAFVRRAVRIKLMDLPFDANAPGKPRNQGESARAESREANQRSRSATLVMPFGYLSE